MHHHYNSLLVLASLVIATLSSWIALELSGHVHAQKSRAAKAWWLAGGACTMGMGIWAMHYVGMLAFQMDVPVLYHWPTVLLSCLAAILASAGALLLVTQPTMSQLKTVAGSLLMGAGIAGMHYIGMAAMRMPCRIVYDARLVGLSVLLAVVISYAALRLCYICRADVSRRSLKRVGSALLMGAAIPTMHYVGMAGVTMQMDSSSLSTYTQSVEVSQAQTVGLIAAAVFLLIVVTFAAYLSRRVAASRLLLRNTTSERDQLRTYHERLTRAYRQNGVGSWDYRVSTGLYKADEYLHEIFGIHTPETPVSMDRWIGHVHPDDRAGMAERFQVALQSTSASVYENEYRLLLGNGVIRHVHTVGNIIRNKQGKAKRVVGLTWDVTQERERQRDTLQQAHRFYTTLEAIGDAIISVDQHNVVLYANPMACRLTGWNADECVGQPLSAIFVTEDEQTGQRRSDPVQRCIAGGGTLLSEDGVLVARTGSRRNIRKIVKLIGNDDGAVITFQDITTGRRMERALQKAATHDALTGLPNRGAFEAQLQHIWELDRNAGRSHALCMLDLDRFKIINDTSGHLAGDAFLRKVVNTLRAEIRSDDMLARMSGDEFLFLLKDTSVAAVEAWARRMLHAVEAVRFAWGNRSYSVTASIGIVLFDQSYPSLDTLLSEADVAMYTAKRNGRNRYTFYSDTDGAAAGHLLEMQTVSQLRAAVEEDRFELHAQPIVPIGTADGTPYFELLIRMRDEHGKLVSPGVFIPAAELYGMMHHIDRWVIRHALQAYAPIHRQGIALHFAVNLSAASLSDPTLGAFVQQQFEEFDVPPSAITFEVTETGMIQDLGVATAFLSNARAIGSRVALDDFGTGMSSLSYLKQFSLDVLKIDGSFVHNLAQSPLDQTIVRSVVQIAHSLGASVVAECVEHLDTVTLLGTLDVDHVQGWATGRPELLQNVLARAAAERLSAEHVRAVHQAQNEPAPSPASRLPQLGLNAAQLA